MVSVVCRSWAVWVGYANWIKIESRIHVHQQKDDISKKKKNSRKMIVSKKKNQQKDVKKVEINQRLALSIVESPFPESNDITSVYERADN